MQEALKKIDEAIALLEKAPKCAAWIRDELITQRTRLKEEIRLTEAWSRDAAEPYYGG